MLLSVFEVNFDSQSATGICSDLLLTTTSKLNSANLTAHLYSLDDAVAGKVFVIMADKGLLFVISFNFLPNKKFLSLLTANIMHKPFTHFSTFFHPHHYISQNSCHKLNYNKEKLGNPQDTFDGHLILNLKPFVSESLKKAVPQNIFPKLLYPQNIFQKLSLQKI